jgi:hypothetical protein
MPQQIYFLHKEISLSPVRKMITDAIASGIKKDEIVVLFDYDETLVDNTPSGAILRGGDTTKGLLNYMNDNHIKWYINTARGAQVVTSVAENMESIGIPYSPFFIKRDQSSCFVEGAGHFPDVFTYKKIEMGVCNNIISASYEKALATDFIFSNLDTLPKLVIFVDDNEINTINMVPYFQTTHPTIDFKCVIYEPIKPSIDYNASAMNKIRRDFPPLIHITKEETIEGGKRRKLKRSRKSRKSRKSKKTRKFRK